METKSGSLIFKRIHEPREKAFSLLAPTGWLAEGGIQRANHMAQQVSAQTIEAKIDFVVKQDASGKALLRFCPEIKYCDSRYMVMPFPVGSNYGGMIVYPLQPAAQFITQMMFPWAHPQAQQAQMLAAKPWEEGARDFKFRAQCQGLPYAYEGCEVTYTYIENGVRFKEKARVVIEDTGQLVMGMWSNKSNHYYRTPVDEFDAWTPVFEHMIRSVKINNEWLANEIVSQQMLSQSFYNAQQAAQMRAQRALETQRYLQDMDRQILEHRRETYAEIRNDSYLLLTGQEEYVNPYTKEIDVASNDYAFRWVTENGDEFYTHHEVDDPNEGSLLNRRDWVRTPVRPRGPRD
jgi:hypothetical protein